MGSLWGPAALAAALVAAAGCAGEGKVALPAGFPRDLPLPPGAALRTAQVLGPRRLNLVYTLDGDAERVAQAHRGRMEGAGWVLVAEVDMARGRVRVWRKDGRSAAVGLAEEGGSIVVSVAYQGPATGPGEGGRI